MLFYVYQWLFTLYKYTCDSSCFDWEELLSTKREVLLSYSLFFSIAQKLEPNLKHQNKALQYGRCGLVRRKKHMPHTKEKIDYTGLHFFWLNHSAGSLLWNNQKTNPSLCFKTASLHEITHNTRHGCQNYQCSRKASHLIQDLFQWLCVFNVFFAESCDLFTFFW
mgnify:CR=1 FL=1